MAAFFFWQKWRTHTAYPGEAGERWPVIWAGFAAVLLALVWFVHEAVPDWSVVNWVFAITVVFYLYSLVASRWGGSTARYFVFPIAFVLCAVPWPQRLELILVQGLMKEVARATVEIVAWFNVPALATGNVILIPNGVVRIDEACSGVRSLQSMLMMSLFFGELLRLKMSRRLGLIFLGLIFALFFNLARTVTLVWIASANGLRAAERWHDPAGLSVLCLSVSLLWLVAQPFARGTAHIEKNGGLARLEPFPIGLIAAFSGWFLFFIVGTEIWYRRGEAGLAPARQLSIVWPTDVSGFSKILIPDSTRRVLLCDDAKCAFWRDQSGIGWSFYSLIWNSGRTSTQSARIHRPENCLQGSGAILKAELDNTPVAVGGTLLAFRTYLFELNGLPLHVFYLIWEDGNRDLDPAALGQDWSGISRLQRVWSGQRNLGQQTLEIVLSGATSDQEARTTLKAELGKIVRIRS